jgi:hypothetical protein
MKKHIIFTLLGLLFSANVMAENGDIEVAGGQAKYQESVRIQLEKLAPNTNYHLSCIVRSDHYRGGGHDDIQVFTLGNVHVFVNRHDTRENNGIVTINAPLNSLKAINATSDGVIFVRNLDRFDTIFVERCAATIST